MRLFDIAVDDDGILCEFDASVSCNRIDCGGFNRGRRADKAKRYDKRENRGGSGCRKGVSEIVFGKAVYALGRFAVAEARLKALPAFVERRFIQCHAAGIRAEDGAYGAERCEFRRAFRARFDVRFVCSDVCFGKFVIEIHRVDIVTGAGRHRLLLIISTAVRVRETRGLLRFLP